MALIKCNECGSEISSKAKSCPTCGYVIKKKMVKNPFLDLLCLLSLVIACFACMLGTGGTMFGFALTLFWLLIYMVRYKKHSKNDEVDCSQLKKSYQTITIFFIIEFMLGIVIF